MSIYNIRKRYAAISAENDKFSSEGTPKLPGYFQRKSDNMGNFSVIFSGAILTFKTSLIGTSGCGSHPLAMSRLTKGDIKRLVMTIGEFSAITGSSALHYGIMRKKNCSG